MQRQLRSNPGQTRLPQQPNGDNIASLFSTPHFHRLLVLVEESYDHVMSQADAPHFVIVPLLCSLQRWNRQCSKFDCFMEQVPMTERSKALEFASEFQDTAGSNAASDLVFSNNTMDLALYRLSSMTMGSLRLKMEFTLLYHYKVWLGCCNKMSLPFRPRDKVLGGRLACIGISIGIAKVQRITVEFENKIQSCSPASCRTSVTTCEVRAKKPSLTLNLEINGLKVTSEPPPMAGQAGRLQGQDRSAVTCPSSGHTRRCLIWLSCDNRRTRYTAPLAKVSVLASYLCINTEKSITR
ncbi:hypothetical protein J6590_094411 [Homalodisca vitripennis]|nr:hypothetical protein J6590_094411 [Homalodisca vitripennis]